MKRLVSVILTFTFILGLMSAGSSVFAGGGNSAVAIEIEDVTVDSTNVEIYCNQVTGDAYFRYEFTVNYSVQLEDGSWLSGNGNRVWYNGEWHDIALYGETQDQVEWHPGGKYRMAAMIDRNATCEFYVNVAKEKAVSLDFDDFYVVDGNSDYQSIDENNEPYTHYRVTPNNYRITLEDGTVITAEGSPYFYIDGESYLPQVFDPQPVAHWKPGGTYQVVASVFGAFTTYKVTVRENPVESVKVNDITLVDHFDGYEYDGKFCYNFFPLDCTVTFKDGTVAGSNEFGNVEWEGEYYFFNPYNPSDMDNWEPGGTYEVEGDFMGVKATFNVNIVANEYTELTIRGKNELVITLTKNDGTKETYHACNVLPGAERENRLLCTVQASEGRLFNAEFVFPEAPSPYDAMYDSPFYLVVSGLTSNTLVGCKWLKNHFFPGGMGSNLNSGDVNGNGTVDMKDILMLRKVLAGASGELTPEQEWLADVDGNGTVNMKDVLLLRKLVAGAVV